MSFATRGRITEAALVGLTLAAVFAAREPADGAAYRWLLAAACLVAAGVVAWYAAWATPSRSRVLLVATGLRLLAFPMEPTLSDDAYRYVWDGLVQAEGYNPYHYRPESTELTTLRGEPVSSRLNSSSYYSVYPPASQLAFRIGAVAYDSDWRASYFLIKAVITAAELGAVALLLRLAAPSAVVLYAWNPLAVLEVAGQGHTEGLAVLGIILGAWGVARRRGGWAGVGLAIAGGAKLLPLALVPFAWRRAGAVVPVAAAASIAVMALPYAAPHATAHVLESLGLYVRSFEFGSGPYMAIKTLAAWAGMGDVSKTLGPILGLAFGAGFVSLLWADRRESLSFAACVSAVYALFFVTATTVHPWYLLPALAVAPLLRRPAVWVWAATIAPATYLFYTGPQWAYIAAVTVGWLGAASLAAGALRVPAVEIALRRRARWKWRWIESALGALPPGSSVLDVGAAEGYVGECAAGAGATVSLVDIVDANRTSLPHVVYDGRLLPLDDDGVDIVLLVFVLHHAREPDLLLSEAARVARRRIVIVESVPRGRMRALVERLDRLSNRLRPVSLRDEERWLRMRPAEEWRTHIEAAGLEIVREERRGRLVHPQALFVTAPQASGATGTRGADETT